MESLFQFRRSRRTVSVGFLTVVAGFFLSVRALPVHAGNVQGPPPWVPFELKATNLYEVGINEKSSDRRGAVKTLPQARLGSAAAITNGGGANAALLHNARHTSPGYPTFAKAGTWGALAMYVNVIGQALMDAQRDAAITPKNKSATATPTSGGNSRDMSVSSHVRVPVKLR